MSEKNSSEARIKYQGSSPFRSSEGADQNRPFEQNQEENDV